MGTFLPSILSFVDLMEQYQLGKLYDAILRIGAMGDAAVRNDPMMKFSMPKVNYEEMKGFLEFIQAELPKFDTPIALSKLEIVAKIFFDEVKFVNNPQFGELAEYEFMSGGRLGNFAQELRVRFGEELSLKHVLMLKNDQAKFFDPPSPLFGDEVANAFPSSSFDISEAGKCRAVGRWTACVVHLMRALEPSIHAFQTHLAVPNPKVNWQDILNQIDAKIKADGPKHPDHQWNSEASAQFMRFKDAWRNYAVHGRDTYDEERAASIFDSVKHFMRHLSTRLHEAP